MEHTRRSASAQAGAHCTDDGSFAHPLDQNRNIRCIARDRTDQCLELLWRSRPLSERGQSANDVEFFEFAAGVLSMTYA